LGFVFRFGQRGNQHAGENGDDGDDDEELDESETGACGYAKFGLHPIINHFSADEVNAVRGKGRSSWPEKICAAPRSNEAARSARTPGRAREKGVSEISASFCSAGCALFFNASMRPS
jgi:hypothetical protein